MPKCINILLLIYTTCFMDTSVMTPENQDTLS